VNSLIGEPTKEQLIAFPEILEVWHDSSIFFGLAEVLCRIISYGQALG
jgi:hypothetical protein